MELGISSWSVPWSVGVRGHPRPARPLDAFGLLDTAVRLGVGVMQIADNLPLHERSASELAELGKAAAGSGVRIEVGTRGLEPEHLARYVAIAEQVGARALRTVLGGALLGDDELAQAERNISCVLPDLERAQVTLAFENNEAFATAQYRSLVRRLASPYVGICLDTANSLGRPEPLETVVAELAEHTVMLHAKDYDIVRVPTRMGFSVVGRPAGAGRVDFRAVVAALRESGRDRISVIVEHWPPFEKDIEATVRVEEGWLTTSVEFLRTVLT